MSRQHDPFEAAADTITPAEYRQLMVKRQLEETTQAHGTDLLELAGYDVTDFSQGRKTRQTEGIPDQYCRHPELRNFWLEWKRPGGRPSRDQLHWHALQRECSGEPVHVIDSLEGLADLLRDYGAQIA